MAREPFSLHGVEYHFTTSRTLNLSFRVLVYPICPGEAVFNPVSIGGSAVPQLTKADRDSAFDFLLWASSHEAESFQYLLDHKVPDDRLAQAADDVTGKKHPIFPRSLKSSSGQQLALAQAKRVQVWKNDMPWMAFTLRSQAQAAAKQEYRSLTRDWAAAIIETILVRCAEERTPKVILGYASIQAVCKAMTGYAPENFADLHRLLDRLVDHGAPFKIEHGKRGDFKRATKFIITLPTHSNATSRDALAGEAQVKDWVAEYVYGLMAAMEAEQHARETLARRKADYAEVAGGVLPELDRWIKEHTVRAGRLSQVSFPGDRNPSLFQGEGGSGKTGDPLVMEDPTPADLQLKKFDVPKSAPLVPRSQPKLAPWKARVDAARRQGRDGWAEALADIDLTIPESEKPKKRTWDEMAEQYHADSVARLDARLAAKGIRP